MDNRKTVSDMLKYTEFQVTFSEVPDEISLCINLSNCPHSCEGCHSPHLQKDVGMELTIERIKRLIRDNNGITCVCFMGGDNAVSRLFDLAEYVKTHTKLKTCWYTGLVLVPSNKWESKGEKVFDYIKSGPYIKRYGPLDSPTTNQRMWMKTCDGDKVEWKDITYRFWKGEDNETKDN